MLCSSILKKSICEIRAKVIDVHCQYKNVHKNFEKFSLIKSSISFTDGTSTGL